MILATVLVTSSLYFHYKTSILDYVCLTESNGPGCYLLYLEYKDSDKSKSRRYLDTSCSMKYPLACDEIKKLKNEIKK